MTKNQIEALKREIENSREVAKMYDRTGRVFLSIGNRDAAYERRSLALHESRKAELLERQLIAAGVTL